jgi:hypothetical protein
MSNCPHNSSKDIDQKPLPSPEPSSAGVQSLEEQTTPRPSITHLSQLEYSIPNTSDSSIGGSTLALSTESFSTAVNTSDPSLPMHGEAGHGSQSVDRGISHAISGQSAIRLHQPGYSSPHTSIPSASRSTHSPSTESFETAISISEVQLSTQPAVVVIHPRSVDRGICHVASKQSPVRLPHPEYSIPNTSASSIGDSTLSPSIESLEALVNTFEVTPPIRAAAAKGLSPQSVDSGLNQAKSRQSIAIQPLQEPPNPATNTPSIGGNLNTLSPPSSESFETLVNTSEVSLPMPVAASKPPYSVDSGIIDQTTPRQSVTRLPELDYTNPNTSLGGITPFPRSADSFETLVNTPEVSFPTAAGKRRQSVDSGIDLQVEVTTPDDLSTPPTSAPPASLLVTTPSPSPAEGRELQSAHPVRKWETHGNWFKKYKYDYETESWIPRES